jgi:hypothetical protein
VAGAGLGALAGLVQITVGPDIREWVGDKQDTTRLGLATFVLSVLALAAAGYLWRRPNAPAPARLLAAAGLLIPAAICLTTVGRLWFGPGALLVAAGLLVLAGLRGEHGEISRALGRHGSAGLTVLLAAYYVFLGAVALGLAGALGVVGGLLIGAALVVARRYGARIGATLLVVGAAPFAVLTWWSLVTPLIAALVLTVGGRAVVRQSS